MSQRRPWTEQEDREVIRLHTQNDLKSPQSHKLKWDDIAIKLHQKIVSSNRSGKQCRQRWHNQLDPNIKRDEEWTQSEILVLLQKQKIYGNKWAEIAKFLKGRTDNNVKNYFYSTLRRGVRRINAYIVNIRKKKNLRKQFHQNVLSKILAVADHKQTAKIEVKKQMQQIIALAKSILDSLLKLSQQEKEDDQPTQNNAQYKDMIIQQILQFNRSCKRKKSKKKQDHNKDIDSQIQQNDDNEICDQQYEQKQKQKDKDKASNVPMFKMFQTTTNKDMIPQNIKNTRSKDKKTKRKQRKQSKQSKQSKNEKIKLPNKTKKLKKLSSNNSFGMKRLSSKRESQNEKEENFQKNNIQQVNLRPYRKQTKDLNQSFSMSKIMNNEIQSKRSQNEKTSRILDWCPTIKKKQTQQQEESLFAIPPPTQLKGLFQSIESRQCPYEPHRQKLKDSSMDFFKMSGFLGAPLNLGSSFSFVNNSNNLQDSDNNLRSPFKKLVKSQSNQKK